MYNTTLKEILKQYELKRNKAINDLNLRKTDLYYLYPKLKNIEDELYILSINLSKNILLNKNNIDIQNLKNKINNLKIDKNNFLNSLNLTENYLFPFYECTTCNDTGYILNNNKTIMCNCLKQELFNITYNKSNIGNLKNENFNKFNLNLYSGEINKEKYKSDISPKENINLIKEICFNFINNFNDHKEKNLLFTGNTGLRKNIFI